MTAAERERIAILETEVSELKADVREMAADVRSLLALQNKGMGAFWLASALFGTGIIGAGAALWKALFS